MNIDKICDYIDNKNNIDKFNDKVDKINNIYMKRFYLSDIVKNIYAEWINYIIEVIDLYYESKINYRRKTIFITMKTVIDINDNLLDILINDIYFNSMKH